VPFGAHQDLELLALLVVVGALLALSPTLRLPLPILLVLGGVALGFIPGLPHIALPPDLVLVAILPPLLYSGAFFTSLRDLRTNRRPIGLLAVGLVGTTMAAVAVVAHEWVGLPWAVAFTLGAVVSPTDALAATEITSRLGAPRRIVSLIEGESLVNDGTALVLYKAAVGAALGGTFSLLDTSGRIVLNVVGGIAIGLGVGWCVRQVRRRIDDPPVEVAIAVLSGYLAYLPAAAVGVSGVLAAVTIGVYMGWYTPELTTERTRLSGDAFWEILVFLVNALLFVLVGLQLRRIVDALLGISSARLVGYAALVSATVILTRLFWVPIFTYLPRWAFPRVRARDPYPPWQWPVLLSWVGIRGAVSLVAALALPNDFPNRELIVFITFAVIVATLVLQGLTLPSLIRVLGISDDGSADREDAKARIRASEAALARLEELVDDGAVYPETAERLRGAFGFRRNRFRARLDENGDGAIEEQSIAYQRVMRQLLDAERAEIIALRNNGIIDDNVMQRVQRDLDLEAARLDQP
jgi:CPA1 family monovalent cation:H+ antiporter